MGMGFFCRCAFFLVCFLSVGEAVEGIDKIYLINLDHRVDRLVRSQDALAPYGIKACRFPAVYGRKLSVETLKDVALECVSGMCRWMRVPLKEGELGYAFAAGAQPAFSEWTSIGDVGCCLSHWAVLREAYESGYETIWVMEDDILVEKDPHVLTGLIEKLDLMSEGKWDVLYTDADELPLECVPECYWWMWRPDLAPQGDVRFSYRERVGEDFVRIGSRNRTHSMIIRRSGMKKLLDHFENNRIFLPIDHEIAFAKDIVLYMLSYPVVTFDSQGDSDIQVSEPVIENVSGFYGWCSGEKEERLREFVLRHSPRLCVEIGAFGGSTSYPIVSALKVLGTGHLYAIDAWSHEEAIRGFSSDDPNYEWWSSVDFEGIKVAFRKQLWARGLSPWCTLMQASSLKAVERFTDHSIDMLYVDGNFSAEGSLSDVMAYFPKVKPSGYIWLNDAHAPMKRASVAYLMERARFIPEASLRNGCVVFQK